MHWVGIGGLAGGTHDVLDIVAIKENEYGGVVTSENAKRVIQGSA